MAPTGQMDSQVLHRMQISGSIRCCLMMGASAGALIGVSGFLVSGAIVRRAALPWGIPLAALPAHVAPLEGNCAQPRGRSYVEAVVLEVHRLTVDADHR